MSKLKQSIWVLVLLMCSFLINATPLTIPNTFSANTPAVAAQVNANFNAAKTSIDDNDGRITVNESDLTTLFAAVSQLQADLATANAKIATLENNSVLELDGFLSLGSYDGFDTAVFTSINVQVNDGSGNTFGVVNGLGNIIIGYNSSTQSNPFFCSDPNEDNMIDCENSFGTWGNNIHQGSHNLILGLGNSYTSYAGIVAGSNNIINNSHAKVLLGRNNKASGDHSFVASGFNNTASGEYSTITAGIGNTASGDGSSVSAGLQNIASGDFASVSGGSFSTANGYSSSITGGGYYDSINDIRYGNNAFADYSTISGGVSNQANGNTSTISGGQNNTTTGIYSFVAGGEFNLASGDNASVCGGEQGEASGSWSSVTGGYKNTASGENASVSGGNSHESSGIFDWRAGGLFEDS